MEYVEDNFCDYVDELYDLGLDDTAYDYYHSILHDLRFKDVRAMKNGDSGYSCFEDVLKDARKTALSMQNNEDDDM